MGRPRKYIVSLSDDDVKLLKSLMRKKKTSRTMRCRCQVLIDLDELHGKVLTREQSAKSNGICMATVSNIIRDYADGGVAKALTYNRSSNSDQARRKVDGRNEAKVIEIACGPAPEGHSRWMLRLLEGRCRVELETSVSKDTIGRTLKKSTAVTRQRLLVYPAQGKHGIRSLYGGYFCYLRISV